MPTQQKNKLSLPNKILTETFNENRYIKTMKESNNLKQKYNYYVQRIDELNEGAIKNIVYLLHTIGNGII